KYLGLELLIVGGVINLIDRLVYGFVRDYWSLLASGIYNNLADYLIALGIVYFFVELKQDERN
ncbi:signal peptidase II, partial [Candidatus Shapirobacteria bacterium]